MPVYGRMPVVAAVKRWSQFPWRGGICIAIQRVADVIWVFLVNARQRKVGEPFSSGNVKADFMALSL